MKTMALLLLLVFVLLLSCLAERDQPNLYRRVQTTQPSISSIDIPDDELADAFQRMEQATYVDLAQRYMERVERRNYEGNWGAFHPEIPSRLITDPKEKEKALTREYFCLAQAQAVLNLASNLQTRGIAPPPDLKDEVILQLPDIYIPLDDLSTAFHEHLVTNTIVFSIESGDDPTNGPLQVILKTYRQPRLEHAFQLLDAERVAYGQLRKLFVPLQLTFVIGSHEYHLAYVSATDGPSPCEAQICLAQYYLLERTDQGWQVKIHPLPEPIASGISRALPCVTFETGEHTRQFALAFRPSSRIYDEIIKRHLTTPLTHTP